jgi:hypothetical protein
MSYRMKITLPDPTMTQLEALAEQRGNPHHGSPPR